MEAFLIAGTPLAALAAMAAAKVRSTRRRVIVNRALHELRRPLQALALAPTSGVRRGTAAAPGPLDMALVALDDLDLALNGTPPALCLRPVAARSILGSAIERWRPTAARRQRSITLDWHAGAAALMADPARIAQALDNLLANAIEHGGLRIAVEASIGARGLRIRVADGGADARPVRVRDPRRGHGLAIVHRIARAHGGVFELRREARGMVATLELPLASAPLAAVPTDWAGRRAEQQAPQRRPPARPVERRQRAA